ncbi:response regulator [Pelagicoccus albus]|uniref:Response regulator n=1 Tax=Pelagicoccus albus TaxID=415222 RepID=A0A7X1B447_9BACT|nr:response regulator [Pelagicoccus albus]MBC2605275.1 response regulator [Pelagicoccus albus]
MTDTIRAIEILLVEDNEADIRLTQIALDRSNLEHNLNVVKDGEQAIAYLKGEEGYDERVEPDLVLLDLNLPKVNGSEVLKDIRATEALKDLPVIVLTTSDADKDIFESYELHANCYLTKPDSLNRFMDVVEMIKDFWTKANTPQTDEVKLAD